MSSGQDRSLEMLSTALELEKKGTRFYEEAISACHNQIGREIFRMLMKDEVMQMIIEEKSHHAALSDMKLYLSDSAAWFVEQEHPGLDGA